MENKSEALKHELAHLLDILKSATRFVVIAAVSFGLGALVTYLEAHGADKVTVHTLKFTEHAMLMFDVVDLCISLTKHLIRHIKARV